MGDANIMAERVHFYWKSRDLQKTWNAKGPGEYRQALAKNEGNYTFYEPIAIFSVIGQ